jgi:solute carrier family 25 protein 34/35
VARPTYPFFRLQLQGELQSKKEVKRLYKGVIHGYGVILKNEGVKGLMRGLGCAVCIQTKSVAYQIAKI